MLPHVIRAAAHQQYAQPCDAALQAVAGLLRAAANLMHTQQLLELPLRPLQTAGGCIAFGAQFSSSAAGAPSWPQRPPGDARGGVASIEAGEAAAQARRLHTSQSARQQSEQHHPQQQQQQQPARVIVLPMPSLSHAMTSGRVSRWLKEPGQHCRQYDVLAEVTTESLVDEAYRVGDFAGSVTLLLESQEEAHLAAVLVREGEEVPIGTPIAVLCEEEGALQAAAASAQQRVAGIASVYEGGALQQPARGGPGAPPLELLEWQSYLKESGKEPGAGNSCGCM